MTMTRLNLGLAGSSLALAVAMATVTPAMAQGATAQPQATNAPADNSPGSIIVTARRTNERLQDVPLQVVALTSDTLKNQNLNDLRSLNNLVPSMNYQGASFSRQGSGRLFFRGLTAGNGSQSSKASLFLDGVYIAGSAQDVAFDLLGRVEALPGPQSAQFGRATFAGAVNYVTLDPGDHLEARVNASYASFGDINVNGWIGGPINDQIKASIFYGHQQYDAPEAWKSPADRLHPDGVDQYGQRTDFVHGKVIFNSRDDNLKVTLRGNANWIKDDPTFFYYLKNRNGTFTKPNGNTTNFPTGGFDINTSDGDIYYTAQNYDQIQDPRYYAYHLRVSGTIDWDVLNHHLTLTGAHEHENSHQEGYDGDATWFPLSTTLNSRGRVRAQSVEGRFASDQEQGFRYTVGGFYLKQSTNNSFVNKVSYQCANGPAFTGGPQNVCTTPNIAQLVFDTSTLAQLRAAGLTGTITAGASTPNNVLNEIEDVAGFGQAAVDFGAFTLTGELRYQEEKLTSRNMVNNSLIGARKFTAWLPRINLQYKLSRDIQFYGVYSVGNNPGGFNTSPLIPLASPNRSFDEEKLYNYEFGVKASWFNGKLTTNLAAYHMDWKSQTVLAYSVTDPVNNPGTTPGLLYSYLINAGNSTIDGFGLEIFVNPVRGLDLRSTISYNKAKYGDYCSATKYALLNTTTNGCDPTVKGNRLEGVPPWSVSASANWQRPLTDDWDYLVRALYQYQDGQFADDLNLVQSAAANVVNLNLGVTNKALTVEVFCTNCTQEEAPYRATVLTDPRFGTARTYAANVGGTPRRPRQFGLQLRYRY